MRSPTLRALALAAATGAVAVAAPLAAPAAATTLVARPGRPTCKRAGSQTIVSSPTIRVYAIVGRGDDQEYGPPTTIVACWRAREGRRVVLQRHRLGLAVFVDRKRLSGRYVALQSTIVDAACTKYMGSSPECVSYRLASYDLRTGRRRAQGDGDEAAAFALTARGWLAWVTQPDAGGAATVFAQDGAGRRQLDAGAIDPRSLSVTADVVAWTRDGVEQTATLR